MYSVKVLLSAVRLILMKLKHFYFLSVPMTYAGSTLMQLVIRPLLEDYQMELQLILITSMIEYIGQMLVMVTSGLLH